MKELFDKNNRICSALYGKGKKEQSFYTILSFALFILSGFFFWEFVYELSNMIGSIVSATPERAIEQLIRMLPLILTAFIVIYLSVYCHCAYRAKDEKARAGIWRKNGVVTIVLGLIVFFYVVYGLITKEYASIAEGYVTPLFPLDIAIVGLLISFYGVLSIRYGREIQINHTELPFFNESNRFGHRRKAFRAIYVLGYLVSACGLAGSVYGLYVLDFSHGSIFFNIMLWLNYFVAFVMFFVYRYVYIELKPEYQRTAEVKLSITFLITNIVLFALYLLSVQIQNEAPNQNAFGILPVDFTASFNAFAVIYGLNNVFGPLISLVNGIKRKKQNRY